MDRQKRSRKGSWVLAFVGMYLLVGLVSYFDPNGINGSGGGEGVNPFAGLRVSTLSVSLVVICALASGAAVGMKTAESLPFRGRSTNVVVGSLVGIVVAAAQFSALLLWSVFFVFFMVISLGSMGFL